MKIDPFARPAVDQDTLGFLRDLKNAGVFDTQYDAWAFGAAYALRERLEPKATGAGREQIPPLNTLNDETRFALEQAALNALGAREGKAPDLTEYVSGMAIAGLTALRQMMQDWPIAERIKWVTDMCRKR